MIAPHSDTDLEDILVSSFLKPGKIGDVRLKQIPRLRLRFHLRPEIRAVRISELAAGRRIPEIFDIGFRRGSKVAHL
jgi:hypothetical protein